MSLPAPTVSTRDAILDAAARVFAQAGYRAATVSTIASAAGFTPPTVYAHFGSKQGLLEALATELMTELWAILERPLPAGLDLQQWLELRIRELLELAERRKDTFALFVLRPHELPLIAEHEDEDLRLERYWRAVFEGRRGELGDRSPEEAALVLDGVVYAFVKAWARSEEPSLSDKTRRIVTLVLDGIRSAQ